MTGIVLWQGDGCAYVATDGAGFNSDGTVATLGSKTSLIPELYLAMAYSGRGGHKEVAEELVKIFRGNFSQRQFLNVLPRIVRRIRKRWKAERPETEADMMNEFCVYVASVDDNRPRCYVVTSYPLDVDGTLRPPFQLHEVAGQIVPSVPVQAILGRTWIDGPNDAALLFQAMRGQRFEHMGQAVGVGGDCTYHAVSIDGVTEALPLLSWPDKVGDKIAA